MLVTGGEARAVRLRAALQERCAAHLGTIDGGSIISRIIIAIVGTLPAMHLSSIAEGRGAFEHTTQHNQN